MAFSNYNIDLAKDCIKSVLSLQAKNGFIAHMMGPKGRMSKITQPQVLAWASWEVYTRSGDKEFLAYVAPKIAAFLKWTMKYRDRNCNGLLEWLLERDKNCRCGESGWDNSPRFDKDGYHDAIDFSTFLCLDASYLVKIFTELGDDKNAQYFNDVYMQTKAMINSNLWNDKIGLYFDATFDGKTTDMMTPASFFPMMANIPSKKQAEKMVKVLTDENKFWTKMPIPTITKDDPLFTKDMWRGGTWLNLNYFVMLGLRNYGYTELADELKRRTLDGILKWYEETGNIFEFYDPDVEVCSWGLKRKGDPIDPPDYRKHMHAITDFNWSACFTLLMILE